MASSGKTVTEISREIGLSPSTVRSMVLGRAPFPPAFVVESLIQACHVPVNQARRIKDIWKATDTARRSARESVTTMPTPPKLREDVEGYSDLKPNPLTATTREEFVQRMREFHVWAGEQSYREISRRSGGAIAASTLCEALNPNKPSRLPSMKVVEGFITGCGGGDDDLADWTTAWRLIKMAKTHSNVTRFPSSCRTAG
jgi:hypothetical protein